MNIGMRIDSARDRARCLYDGHCHPFCFNGFKGWHARPGKETVTNLLRLTASSITLRNGACPIYEPNVTTINATAVDTHTTYSLAVLALCQSELATRFSALREVAP
jgi:hypothetical protein